MALHHFSIVYGCHVIAALKEIHEAMMELPSIEDSAHYEEPDHRTRKNPPAPPDLMSIQQTKVTTVISSLLLNFFFFRLICVQDLLHEKHSTVLRYDWIHRICSPFPDNQL